MRKKDTSEVLNAAAAVIADGVAVFGGIMLATWIRFSSGWIPLRFDEPGNVYHLYTVGGIVAAAVHLLVYRSKGMYTRPQTGRFPAKMPRIINAVAWGTMVCMVLAFAFQNEADFSRVVIGIALFTVLTFVMLERWVMYRIEWNMARHSRRTNRVLVLGTDSVAAHVMRTIDREPMLRSKVVGFLRTHLQHRDDAVPDEMIKGTVHDLSGYIRDNPVDQLILTDSSLGHDHIVEIMVLCERNLIVFNMVPDLFRIMTTSMDVQTLEDIPLLGTSRWPLDYFWNRVLKRLEDVVGSVIGLVLAFPLIAAAAILIKRESKGPVFYRQQRCGEDGRVFNLIKLRTMREDAEDATGPVFTRENDPRVTDLGRFLRSHNLDELPQLWNVLRGDMSLVGPRPERPHFVEKFKEDIERYMWRHVALPGMTGWAQINGLRGDTSIEERIKYDLYYLENWSLALDFKILVRTIFAHENAY